VRFQGLTSPPEYQPSAPSRLRPAKRAALCLPDPCGLERFQFRRNHTNERALRLKSSTGSVKVGIALEAVPEGAGLLAEHIARPWALFRDAGWLVTPRRSAESRSDGDPVLSQSIVEARHKVRIKRRHLWAPEPPWAREASRCWASAGPLWGSQARCRPATRCPSSKPPGHSRSRTATRPQDPGSSERAPAQAGGLPRP